MDERIISQWASWTLSGNFRIGRRVATLTCVFQFVHHGILFETIGYEFGKSQFNTQEIKGGSPYGAGTISGNEFEKNPSKIELDQAKFQGKYFAEFVKKLKY